MSEQDNLPAGEPDQPRDMTSDELDEALRWLEELAGKQGKSIDGLVTLDETSLEDSPFKGLFDSDEQELPDWLREVPSVDDEGGELLEGESRLDWLARMASRESVEELPTLEWRRLTEGEEDEDGDLVDAMPETAAAVPGMPAASETTNDTMVVDADSILDETETPAVVELMTAMAIAEDASADLDTEPKILLEAAEPPVETVAESVDPEADTPAPDAGRQSATSESLEAEASDPEDVFGPDDLDEAMAWLEELAASQDAPVEDLPSVADRALASKIIAEAASGMSRGEALDVSQLGIAMSGIYVGETRLAPTGPLVGEAPADETPDSAIYAEITLATEDDITDSESELLLEETSSGEESVIKDPHVEDAILEETVTQDSVDDYIDAAATPVAVVTEEIVFSERSLADLMDIDAKPLPELLTEVDRLAMPMGTSLDEIAALLATDLTMVKVTPYTLSSTLDWLEGKESVQSPADSLDVSLVAEMPDDPDEAQAWLEQMAGENVLLDSRETTAAPSQAAAGLDLSEADLLDMPDDPDAAIAWIESLAANRDRAT